MFYKRSTLFGFQWLSVDVPPREESHSFEFGSLHQARFARFSTVRSIQHGSARTTDTTDQAARSATDIGEVMPPTESPSNPKTSRYQGARGYPVPRATRNSPGTPGTPGAPLTAVDSVAPHERDRSEDQSRGKVSPESPLPDPELLILSLARGVMEALAGVREPEQLARWLSEAAFVSLLRRVVMASRARAVTKRVAVVPTTTILRIIVTQPNVGVIEAVVIVRSRVRVRSVAIRLEGVGDRWRASAIHVI